jgi:hypothetical protein
VNITLAQGEIAPQVKNPDALSDKTRDARVPLDFAGMRLSVYLLTY